MERGRKKRGNERRGRGMDTFSFGGDGRRRKAGGRGQVMYGEMRKGIERRKRIGEKV